jgi:hypothetical protein
MPRTEPVEASEQASTSSNVPAGGRRERAALACLMALFVGTGIAAVDFGDEHWDEPTNVKQLLWAFEHRQPFPRYYYYGTTLMAVLAVVAVPDLLVHGLDEAPRFLMGKSYRLRARAALIALSSLVIWATWLLARALGRPPSERLFAAALVATSWQLGFHARFIAPDGLLAAMTTLVMALVAWSRKRPRLLEMAAIVVGIAAGAKYTAGLLLFVVVAEALVASRGASLSQRARRVALLGLLCALAFLVSTPGALFETEQLLSALRFQSQVYGSGWQGYTLSGPLGFFAAFAGWLGSAALSPFMLLAPLFVALAVGGALAWSRGREGPLTPWLLPTLYLAVFAAQNVFITRNLLGLIPFLAVLAARGAGLLWASDKRSLKLAVLVLSWSVIAAHAAFGIDAAESVIHASPERTANEVRTFVARHPQEVFLASPRVRELLGDAPNVTAEPSASTARLLAFPQELLVEWEWPSHDPFLVERVFGPREIDWRYYTTWRGHPRVVLMDVGRARAIGASLSFTPTPRAPRQRMPMELIQR